ncbi:hypothetical protein SLEP1_g24053 [Rubroshorea leprosula]|uniref:Uncharacterized protein n=1 Tax=Rubroshorea leprosula TaxID=152421 RepID=A0AAV5JRG5_9ROSI|nr:hypothetical protein SLEP1_g24053 [Rubroshorea leprosula]
MATLGLIGNQPAGSRRNPTRETQPGWVRRDPALLGSTRPRSAAFRPTQQARVSSNLASLGLVEPSQSPLLGFDET